MMKKQIFHFMMAACLIIMAMGVSSCNAPDKKKCNSDYIIGERVDAMYKTIFENKGESLQTLAKYATTELAELLATTSVSEGGPHPSFATGIDLQAGMNYSFDGGDPFLGLDELLYRKASEGINIVHEFRFVYSIPDRWGREKDYNGKVLLQIAWQDDDWRIADIIMPNGWHLTDILKVGWW